MKFQGDPWNSWNSWASTQPATQKSNIVSCVTKLQKFRCKTFHRKTYATFFRICLQYFVQGCEMVIAKLFALRKNTKINFNRILKHYFYCKMYVTLNLFLLFILFSSKFLLIFFRPLISSRSHEEIIWWWKNFYSII